MWDPDSLPRAVEDITFAQLRAFACAARCGSFAKAGQLLNISQPAISEQINALEFRLGRCLFTRRRGTTPLLTPDGQDALEMVETILSLSGELFETLKKPRQKIILRISLAPFLRDDIKPLIRQIYREHPDVEIDFYHAISSEEAMRLIGDGTLDLAIFAMSVEVDKLPHARRICDLPMAMVASPDTRARLSAGECVFDDFRVIFPVRRDLGLGWARKALRDLGLESLNPPLFVEFIDVLAEMVENGEGVGYVMTYTVADRISAGRLEVLDLPLKPMRRFIARAPHAPEVARTIEELFREALSV